MTTPDQLVIERSYERDNEAVARAVAILLREKPDERAGEAA